jgi:parallel beta-helix repeat protein
MTRSGEQEMAEQKPAAFMSYVHADDKYGHLTTFRERLGDEVRVQTGVEFSIFQDRKDIHWGQNWRDRIEGSLDEVAFLIPVITPSFFNSQHCRGELHRFLEREKNLNRSDLILPVYYVDTPLLNEDELRAGDELAQAIASRQFADWRDLRFEPFTNPLVGRTLAQLAKQIRDALLSVNALNRAQPTAPVAGAEETAAARQTRLVGNNTSAAQIVDQPANARSKLPVEPPSAKNEPPTRVIDPWHRGDYTTISEAIAEADPGDRIILRPGFYQEGLVIDKPLEIIGDGEAGEIVIQVADKNVILFKTNMGRVANLTLRQMGGGDWYAVDIMQGRLELEGCDITSQSLACVAIRGGADPRLRRNRIHDGKQSGVYINNGGQGTLEDNDIFGNAYSGVEVETGGNPTLRRNLIHDNKGGVYVRDSGQGTLEDNDIFGNAYSGVEIKTGGNTTLRRNRIHDGKQCGVYINNGGQGTLEDNDIFGNAYSGVQIRKEGNPTLRGNRINKNRGYAIWISEGGGGVFEGNDLRSNVNGAWLIAYESKPNVKRVNNQE